MFKLYLHNLFFFPRNNVFSSVPDDVHLWPSTVGLYIGYWGSLPQLQTHTHHFKRTKGCADIQISPSSS